MKIILWGINYAPESIGIAPFNCELGEYLRGLGHEVTAVTSFAYYPHWRKAPEDRARWHREEWLRGVHVHRCGCYVPAVVTTFRRVAHELSFGLVSLLQVLRLPRADVYFVVSPPLVLGFFAWIATSLKRSRFVFHVQDLQPDAAVGLGMLRRGPLVRALFALEQLAYSKAAAVSGISEGMIAAFRQKGVPSRKRFLLPNWLRSGGNPGQPSLDRAAARRHFDVPEDRLLAIYAGNLGRKQGLDVLIETAFLLAEHPACAPSRVDLIIAGDGAGRRSLERTLRAHPLARVRLLPLLSDEDYATLLRAADVALITQTAGTGRFFSPSKLLSVLAAGLPVVAVTDDDSELARSVTAGAFGCVVHPGDTVGLAAVLGRLSDSPAQLAAWSERTEWVQQFKRDSILPAFEGMLRSVAGPQGEELEKKSEAIAPA